MLNWITPISSLRLRKLKFFFRKFWILKLLIPDFINTLLSGTVFAFQFNQISLIKGLTSTLLIIHLYHIIHIMLDCKAFYIKSEYWKTFTDTYIWETYLRNHFTTDFQKRNSCCFETEISYNFAGRQCVTYKEKYIQLENFLLKCALILCGYH